MWTGEGQRSPYPRTFDETRRGAGAFTGGTKVSDHKRYHGHRLFGELMPPDRALALALDAVRPIERVERVPLTEATDRVLAQEVSSPVDVPDFPKAMMDGFAVRSEDVADGRTELRVVGEAHPGEPYAGVVGPRETVKTATGAPVPEGSDLVIEIEEVTFDEARAEVPGGLVPGRNVQPVGQDIGKGDRLLAEGLLLQPGHIGAAAALGIAELPVYARPRVAVFATGREIKRAGPLAPGEIYDINSYTLSGLIRAHGGTVELFDPIRDTYENIRGAVARAADFDAVVLSGSTSVGERDYLRDAAAELGEVLFHGLAVSPGKPLLMARVRDGLVLGLPGFPASCLMIAYHILVPVLRRLARVPGSLPTTQATLAEDMPVKAERTQLMAVHLKNGKAYRAFEESGSITSVSKGEGYVVIPQGEKRKAGDEVEVILFGSS